MLFSYARTALSYAPISRVSREFLKEFFEGALDTERRRALCEKARLWYDIDSNIADNNTPTPSVSCALDVRRIPSHPEGRTSYASLRRGGDQSRPTRRRCRPLRSASSSICVQIRRFRRDAIVLDKFIHVAHRNLIEYSSSLFLAYTPYTYVVYLLYTPIDLSSPPLLLLYLYLTPMADRASRRSHLPPHYLIYAALVLGFSAGLVYFDAKQRPPYFSSMHVTRDSRTSRTIPDLPWDAPVPLRVLVSAHLKRVDSDGFYFHPARKLKLAHAPPVPPLNWPPHRCCPPGAACHTNPACTYINATSATHPKLVVQR